MLIVLGVGAFRLFDRDIAGFLEHWIKALRLDPGEHFFDMALAKAADLTPQQIRNIGLGSFFYAGLFSAEGTGLWLRKRWGEWLTVIITGSLIPIEIYEMVRHIGPAKVAVLVLNVAIVAYLIFHIRSQPTGSK